MFVHLLETKSHTVFVGQGQTALATYIYVLNLPSGTYTERMLDVQVRFESSSFRLFRIPQSKFSLYIYVIFLTSLDDDVEASNAMAE